MRTVLRWFWAPVRDNENWAQTLVRVIGNLSRSLLTIVVFIALWIGIANVLRPPYELAPDERDRIVVTVNTDAHNGFYTCNAEYPTSIAVVNNSEQTLMSMDIELTARRRGRSTNVLPYPERTVRWDQIVPPGHALAMCYQIGSDLDVQEFVLSGQPLTYSVVLRPTEEWMLTETDAFALAPPCRDGSTRCEPWERDWGDAEPTDGIRVTEDGVMLPQPSD